MHTRPRFAGLATLFSLTLAAAWAGSEEPPSSLQPAARLATVRLSLEQRVVRECRAVEGARPVACVAREERSPAKTSVTLRPIREASLRGRRAERAPVTWAIDSADANPSPTRSLAPGLWRLEWPGYEKQPTFRADAGAQMQIKLRVRRGRCEPVGKDCALVLAALERQIEISLQ